MRFWKAARRRLWGFDEWRGLVESWAGDEGGEDVGEDGSEEGACLLLRGRTV